MTNGGWHSQEQRHGRHRQGATGAAWTPAVRPTDSGPVHARRGGFVPPRPADTPPTWPVSEVLTRRPGWPVDPEVPAVPTARQAAEVGPVMPAQARPPAPAWPGQDAGDGLGGENEAARHRGGGGENPASGGEQPGSSVAAASPKQETGARHAAPPKRKLISADMVLDTVPMGTASSRAVVHTLSETTATGLRKFDLGNVPASVTPPRSWRRAAWFTVGTSAAVVIGLAVVTTELMGRSVSDDTVIDAMPAYPTGPLTLAKLPHEETTSSTTDGPTTSSRDRPRPSTGEAPEQPSADTVVGSTTYGQTTDESTTTPTTDGPPSQDTTTTPPEPARRTVGAAPVTPTDPQAMGDRTEYYFALVINDPAAAHAMTTGDMAREGQEGIEARYGGVRRVEVQDITIDRNKAVTTSTIKIIRDDGTEIIERRQLTFTWGGDPKIMEDAITG